MEQHNHITYWRFREGICQALELDDKASEAEKDALIKEVETKWWFCGGRDTRPEQEQRDEGDKDSVPEHVLAEWARLWEYYFPGADMPGAESTCVCNQGGLRYNTWITDGERVVVIGRVCLRQFLPRQAKKMNSKRCDRCFKPHQNRKDNYCKACRVLNKQDEARQVKEDYERRLVEQAKRNAEEAIRRAKEAQEQAMWCECGMPKQPQYAQCYYCAERKKKEEVAKMTPQQRKAMFCDCGAKKKPQFPTCWSCRGGRGDGGRPKEVYSKTVLPFNVS